MTSPESNGKPTICLYFHVHQPVRVKRFSMFEKKKDDEPIDAYFDHSLNRHYFERAAKQCYLPANAVLLGAAKELGDSFKVNFSITGVFIEQCLHGGELGRSVLAGFQKLAAEGCAEFLDETYYHSLASMWPDKGEFREQVMMHRQAINEHFGLKPTAFRNTELLYSDDVAKEAERMGYKAVISEGIERVLGWRSPNYVYNAAGSKIKLLLRNYKLSDDVGYRFSARWWPEWPLTADKYTKWLSETPGDTINLFMDYETIGEHHWPGSGIYEFFHHFPRMAVRNEGMRFASLSETAMVNPSRDEISVPHAISWADMERDSSTWLGNSIQWSAFNELRELGKAVKDKGGFKAVDAWRKLTTSDHFMYMCTKSWADGDVHKHFSPHKNWTPYDNYINYMNILHDFKARFKDARKSGEAAPTQNARPAQIEANQQFINELVSALRS